MAVKKCRIITAVLAVAVLLVVVGGFAVGRPLEATKGLYSFFAFIGSKYGLKLTLFFYVMLLPLIEGLWRKAYVDKRGGMRVCSMFVYAVGAAAVGMVVGEWWIVLLLMGYVVSLFVKGEKWQRRLQGAMSVAIICVAHGGLVLAGHWTAAVVVVGLGCMQVVLLWVTRRKGVVRSMEVHAAANALVMAAVCLLNGGLTRDGAVVDRLVGDGYTMEIRQLVSEQQCRAMDEGEYVGAIGRVASEIANAAIRDSVDPCRRYYIYRASGYLDGRCPLRVKVNANDRCVNENVLHGLMKAGYLQADTVYEETYSVEVGGDYVLPPLDSSTTTLKDVLTLYVRPLGHPFVVAEGTNERVPTDFSYISFPIRATHEQVADTLRSRGLTVVKEGVSRMRVVGFHAGPRIGLMYKNPLIRALYEGR